MEQSAYIMQSKTLPTSNHYIHRSRYGKVVREDSLTGAQHADVGPPEIRTTQSEFSTRSYERRRPRRVTTGFI